MADYEARLTIKEWLARIYPNSANRPTVQTVKNWISGGKVRGGSEPGWFVYEDWEPRQGTGNPLADKILRKSA